jgi:hypothetical protein
VQFSFCGEELMIKNLLAAAVTLMCVANVQAIGPGNLGSADNQTFLLAAAHSGTFIDAYEFDVSSNGFAGGAILAATPL